MSPRYLSRLSAPERRRRRPSAAAPRRRETDGRERDPGFVSDAYAECYPAYHDYARAVVDSDDEADFSHMDGKAGSGRSRTDFATDEEWQARAGQGRVSLG